MTRPSCGLGGVAVLSASLIMALCLVPLPASGFCHVPSVSTVRWHHEAQPLHPSSGRGRGRRHFPLMSSTSSRPGGAENERIAKLKAEKEELMRKLQELDAEVAVASTGAFAASDLTAEEQEAQNAKYRSNAARTEVNPLHRPVFEKLNEALGNVRVFATDEMSRKALRGIEEDDDEDDEDEEDEDEDEDGVGERGEKESKRKMPVKGSGARKGTQESSRDRNDDVESEELQGSYEGPFGMRYFKYRTHEGDYFAKIFVVDEPDVDFSERKRDEDSELLEFLAQSGMDMDLGVGISAKPKSKFDIPDLDLDSLGDFDLEGDFDMSAFSAMNAGQPSGGLGQGGDKRGGQGQASAGGLILDVSGAMAESMGLKLGEGSGKPKKLGFPHDMIEGEMQSLRAIAETKSIYVPKIVTSGDLREEQYAREILKAKGKDAILPAGGFIVTEFLDCKTKGALGPTPYLVGEVGEKLALMHMRSEGFSTTYGFDCDTYVGFQKQDNTRRADFSDFLVTNRVEPQLRKATKELRSKWKHSQEGRRLCKELDEMAFKVVDRLTDSYIWNELVFPPALEGGPRLLHGDMWVGNMAVDGKANAVAFNPACWYGPSEFDLSVGMTFGMPERFFQAYHHHIPRVEDFDMRMKVYKLYHLLMRLNSADATATKRTHSAMSYQADNFNGGRTLTSFKTTSVLNPSKHQYRSEMEMITKGTSESSEMYLKETVELMKEIVSEDPPKVGQVFKFWGQKKEGSGDGILGAGAQGKNKGKRTFISKSKPTSFK